LIETIDNTSQHVTGRKQMNTYQPAGKIEKFFQRLADFKDLPTRDQALAPGERTHGLTSAIRVAMPSR